MSGNIDQLHTEGMYLFELFQRAVSVEVVSRTSTEECRRRFVPVVMQALSMFTLAPLLLKEESRAPDTPRPGMQCCFEAIEDPHGSGVQWVLSCIDNAHGHFYTTEPHWSAEETDDENLLEQLFAAVKSLLDQRVQSPGNLL